MPIDKYLCNVNLPDFQPGPFTVRLKYELKQLYFDKKLSNFYHYVYSSAILGLFVICLLLVFKPQTAHNINSFVFRTDHENALDMLLLAEKDIDISNLPSNIRTVSTEMPNSLSFLEDDKSYLIHKFRNHENKTMIYISEVKNQQQQRILY
ncbi:MAG: hypothetical protein FWG98_00455 [Candidatus Cloacimonetes bacterium]|nr:hypothetical protein [Candidatus Cloacimonadota bacterium]